MASKWLNAESPRHLTTRSEAAITTASILSITTDGTLAMLNTAACGRTRRLLSRFFARDTRGRAIENSPHPTSAHHRLDAERRDRHPSPQPPCPTFHTRRTAGSSSTTQPAPSATDGRTRAAQLTAGQGLSSPTNTSDGKSKRIQAQQILWQPGAGAHTGDVQGVYATKIIQQPMVEGQMTLNGCAVIVADSTNAQSVFDLCAEVPSHVLGCAGPN